ncbi:hypothetical protein JCM33374_g1226 [Metschnikowia sp. JCM 33374]|nr:hypothetical protein JCM33374_g1226 [Metschnikowia sp. JCM 33374]
MRRAVSKFIPNKFGKSPSDSSHNSYRLDHGSVDEFYIALDDPHRSWTPGDEISGQVILRSRKNLANITIRFNLSGYVKIHASPHSKLRPMKTVLFSHTIQIYGPNTEISSSQEFANGLYKGEHRFPFIVKLPNKRIFTSIDFGKGAIMYVLSTHLASADPSATGIQNPPSAASSPVSSSFNGSGGPGSSSGTPGTLISTPNTSESSSLAKAKEAFSKIHNPTYAYEKIINLVNPVDVAYLPAPKRKRLIIKNPRKGKLSRVQSSTSTINTFGTISSATSDQESIVNTNPSPSLDMSFSAPNTQSTAHMGSPQNPSSPGTPSGFQPVKPASDTIRVSMDVAQRGYLRGELIPIKISINHLRKIQDSTGIIVTLVRVCRIDYGPDGYYESFRKDLQQSVIPLFVDPNTFSSEISTSMRVPPDAFPTISGCPLVSFQYFIEVMLNLSGKSLSLNTPSEQPKSNTAEDTSQGLSPGQTTPANYNFQSLAHSRSEYINTDKFKRSKKFLQMTTEVVIGTHRSMKPTTENLSSSGVISSANDAAQTVSMNSNHHSHSPRVNAGQSSGGAMAPAINTVPELSPMVNFDSPPYLYGPSQPNEEIQGENSRQIPTYEDVAISPPGPDLPVLSEKERMRQHEASLLPSAPPLDDSEASDSEAGNTPIESPLSDTGAHQNIDIIEGNSETQPLTDRRGTLGSNRQYELSEEDLYQAPDIHEGIGSEGANEYVPNYNAAANDRLVDSNK